MIQGLLNMRDRFFGRGHYAITVPPMDGAFRPNNRIEEAPVLADLVAPGLLQTVNGVLWFSSGNAVMRMTEGQPEQVSQSAAPVSALAVNTKHEIALACLDGTLSLPDGVPTIPEDFRHCVTGMAFDADGGVFVTVGSTRNGADAWQKDLLEHGKTGSLWHLPLNGAARKLADGLSWPEAPLVEADGSVLFSESSACRVSRVDVASAKKVLIAHLPGYPAGLAKLGAGYALCLKAPRNQLIEFVLSEREFVAQMIDTALPEHWIAPSLYPQESFLEPLQGGALKQLGIMKPWAPSRSGGLVVELNADFVPQRSFHSRADGRRHGTVSCVALDDGTLAVASVGAGCVVTLDPKEEV
jgi:hypothetical protein